MPSVVGWPQPAATSPHSHLHTPCTCGGTGERIGREEAWKLVGQGNNSLISGGKRKKSREKNPKQLMERHSPTISCKPTNAQPVS